MARTAQRLLYLLLTLLYINQCPAQDTAQIVTAWLKQNSFPLQTFEPRNPFSDLKPLKRILKGVSVVGLGESTHGTREFFQMKHRLVHYLVTEMNFSALVMEASNTACQPINDYILTGKGDRATVLTGQGYTAWDTEEFSAMLDWMRTYNQQVPEEKKVKFYGMDVLCCHQLGRERVMAYLQKYIPENVAATDSLFLVLASEDEKWPSRLNQTLLQQALIPLHELVSYFTTNKNQLVDASSQQEWEQTYHYLKAIERGLFANVKEVPPSVLHLKKDRGHSMAETVFYLMDREKPDAKFIVWAYNYHISNDTAGKNTGYHLRQRLGDQYYALRLECNEGTFQTRVLQPDGYWGELKTDTILAGAPKSLTWYLYQVANRNAFVNLRSTVTNPVIQKWLETPISYSAGVWVYRGATKNVGTTLLRNKFDGIVYIERSTPVRPTRNAVTRSSKK